MLLSKHTLGNAVINGPVGGNIKSIQTGYSYLSNATSANVTINSVDINNSVVRIVIEGQDSDGNNSADKQFVTGTLTDATTLNLSRNTSTVSVIALWTVVEFQNVKSLQKGTTIVSSTNQAVTINTVDLAKSDLFASYKTAYTNTTIPRTLAGYYIASTTSIRLNIPVAGSNWTFNWYVVEFK